MTRATVSRAETPGRRAFTLLELLLVLGLLIAIFAIAVPIAFQSMRGRDFRRAEELVLAGLESVRAHAQREGIIVELTIDAAGHRVRAFEIPLDGSEARPIEALHFEIAPPVRLTVAEGGGTMVLYLPDGSAPASRPCMLLGAEGEQAMLTISPTLGRATSAARRSSEVVPEVVPDLVPENAPSPTGAARPEVTD